MESVRGSTVFYYVQILLLIQSLYRDTDLAVDTNHFPESVTSSFCYYQSVWPELFRDIEAKLQDEPCGVSVIAIKDVGSTSIPGLPVKPILDIDVLVARQNVAAATGAL